MFWLTFLLAPIFAFVATAACCAGGCEIFSDTFTRSTLGSGWTVETGSASIVNNQLRLESNSIALVAASHPDSSGSGKWKTNFFSLADGDDIRLIFGWLDSSNYCYGRFVRIGTAGQDLQYKFGIYQVASGVTTLVSDEPAVITAAPSTATICAYDNWATLSVLYQPPFLGSPLHSRFVTANSLTIPGDRVGLATGTVGSTAKCDSVAWLHNQVTRPACPCDTCDCANCSGDTPCELQVELDGITNSICSSCAGFNGVYLLGQFDQLAQFDCQWGTAALPNLCGSENLFLNYQQNFGGGLDIWLIFDKQFGSDGIAWSVPAGTWSPSNPEDCMGWTPRNLGASGNHTFCDFRSATAFVTAVTH